MSETMKTNQKIKKLVSIIMPAYNRAKLILRSIKSVLNQTYEDFELIIIDDGSTDETEEVIMSIKDPRIRYVKLVGNHGACYARNQGLELAKGEYIAFLDTDNVWMKNYLEERVKILKKRGSKVGGVFGYFIQVRGGQVLGELPSKEIGVKIAKSKSNKELIRTMLYGNIIDTNTIVLKKCCVEKINGFNESIMRLQDWEYFFRIVYYSGYRILFQENCLVKNYLQKDSITSNKNNKAYWDTKIFFINQYKEILKENNCLYEVFLRWCYQEKPPVDIGIIARLLETIKDEKLENIIMSMRKKYLENRDLALNLHTREKMIIELQNNWLNLKRKNVDLGNVLKQQGFNRVVIYGFGYLGKSLYEELKSSNSECKVTVIFDSKLEGGSIDNIFIIKPNREYFDADIVIVTALYDFEQIKKQYEKEIPYVSLKTIIEKAQQF